MGALLRPERVFAPIAELQFKTLKLCKIVMPKEFDIQKLKSEYPEFFEKVSPGLLEFILSEKASSKIAEVCLENGVKDEEKIEKIAYRVVLALLGQIPKESLAEILEKGVKLNSETASKIYAEINRLIFSQIKKTKPKEAQLTQQTKPSPPVEEKPKGPSKKDTYREPIE